MFQKPPKMFHLEHPHGGGAFTEIAGIEVVLHHVRLMSLADDLVRRVQVLTGSEPGRPIRAEGARRR